MTKPRNAVVTVLALLFSMPVRADAQEDRLLKIVQGFYSWVLLHGKETAALQPAIKDVAGSTRFYLDSGSEKQFVGKFMSSGYFAPEFESAVSRYYAKYAREFAATGQKEFDQFARDGRGPMMEVEDMDIFFCAQEYEYQPEFIGGFKVKSAEIKPAEASLVVVSPYQWETEFEFGKVQGKWLITGYCVFR